MLNIGRIASLLTIILLVLLWRLNWLRHIFAAFAILLFYGFRRNPTIPFPDKFLNSRRQQLENSALKQQVPKYPLLKNLSIIEDKQIPQIAPDTIGLGKLRNLIMQDFVRSWYSSVSSNLEFLRQVELVLDHSFREITRRFQNVDLTNFILVKVVNVLNNHYREMQIAMRLANKGEQLEQVYLGGKLHPAVPSHLENTSDHQFNWLRKRLNPLIPLLLPRNETSKLGWAFYREMLISCLLKPTIDTISDPDYWNQTFVYYGDLLLSQQVHSGSMRKPDEYIDDGGGSNRPKLDDYMKQVNNCKSIVEAGKLKDALTKEIQTRSQSISISS